MVAACVFENNTPINYLNDILPEMCALMCADLGVSRLSGA